MPPLRNKQVLRYLQGMAAIVQWQNAGLWIRMSWVQSPLAAPSPASQGTPEVFGPRLRKLRLMVQPGTA